MSEAFAPATPVDTVVVEFPATEGYRSVGRLVLGGLASRFDLPVDRVEELLLALESLLLQELAGDTVTLEIGAAPDGLRTRLGPFAHARLGDPAVGRVLERLVDEVSEGTGPTAGGSDGVWVDLVVTAARLRDDG